MTKVISQIRSGGQTGSDRGALDAALAANFPITGWCPKGGWAEDLQIPPGLLGYYPQLKETPSSDVIQRTEWNVRDADATLIFQPENQYISKGTNATITFAKEMTKPYVIITKQTPAEILDWLHHIGEDLIVNVAGPRESEMPGTYAKSYDFIKHLLSEPHSDN